MKIKSSDRFTRFAPFSRSGSGRVVGLSSGSSAIVSQCNPLRLNGFVGTFSGGEYMFGTISGAITELSADKYFDGRVDVSIKNSFGSRQAGSRLTAAFEYKVI